MKCCKNAKWIQHNSELVKAETKEKGSENPTLILRSPLHLGTNTSAPRPLKHSRANMHHTNAGPTKVFNFASPPRNSDTRAKPLF